MPKLVVSRLYLVNSRWIKYVNNLRVFIGLIGGNLSTIARNLNILVFKKWLQNQLSTTNYHFFYPIISTDENYILLLLNIFYTHNPQGLLLKLKNIYLSLIINNKLIRCTAKR